MSDTDLPKSGPHLIGPSTTWNYDDVLRGVDIHGGLRIRFDRNGASVALPLVSHPEVRAVYSAAVGTQVPHDIHQWLAHVRLRVRFVEAWLEKYEAQRPTPPGEER